VDESRHRGSYIKENNQLVTKSPAARFLGGISVLTGLKIGKIAMKTIAIQSRDRNRSLEPDLFSWRQTPPRNASRVAVHIARRFGLSLDHASTIAQLAGFSVDEAHHES
jgi:hypothetical protein